MTSTYNEYRVKLMNSKSVKTAMIATVTANPAVDYTVTLDAPMLTGSVNRTAQELVTAGTAEGGTMYYAVTTENTAPTDATLYTTSIPAATEAGTYYVWYMAVGDENHLDTEPACVTVIIEAVAEPEIEMCTVTFDANGGKGNMKAVQVEKGKTLTLPKCKFTAPDGKIFSSWDKGAVGKTIKVTKDLVIKAKWKNIPVKKGYSFFSKMVSTGKTALKLNWEKVSSADGYEIWMTECGVSQYSKVGDVSATKLTYTVKKLKKNKGYKAYVRAYKKDGKEKVYITGNSPIVHAITGGGGSKTTNPASVTVKKAEIKLTLSKKNQYTIKATVKGLKSGLTIPKHGKLLRYYSSNTNIAEVDENGVITAVNTGKSTIYVMTSNGIRAKVNVTVTR